MKIKVHAICMALNEAPFIRNVLKTLYPFCSGISFISQYDRDYYGRMIEPDQTIPYILDYPDPEGKIHLTVRRFRDETAARNMEMLSHLTRPDRKIISHGVDMKIIRDFHAPPDYFLIVDADELYDMDTFGNVLEYLGKKKPRGMRMSAYEYVATWNQRIPWDRYVFHQFGFVKAGLLFEQRRVLSWNEIRLRTLLQKLKMEAYAARSFGFIDCPTEVGIFHHGAFLGGEQRMKEKFAKHSHLERKDPELHKKLLNQYYEHIPTAKLPRNIREGQWPANFFD